MDAHRSFTVLDHSHAGEVRRNVASLAASLGLDASDSGRAAIVVTEAATNILKHAGKGQLLLRALREDSDRPGIEVIALDSGPGMADVARCMQDGYSTAGSPGTGLGAISRLASLLDIYSAPSRGTVLLARILARGARPGGSPMRVGAVRVAAPGESECGDDWSVQQAGRRMLMLVADGLGHGGQAAAASLSAVRAFEANSHLPIDEILQRAHGALLATRGAAVTIAEVDYGAGEVRFAGVGNVAGFLAWPGGMRSMVTQNGTVGAQISRIRVMTYPWRADSLLVMHTDGLSSHVRLDGYPGLLARHPSLIAAVLYRDFGRGRDDATVVVAGLREAGT